MKKRIIQFLTTYFLFVLLFVLQKPIFMVYYHDLYTNVSLGDYFRVMWHGLPLDLSLAGYLTAIPGILLIASAWTNSSILRRIRQGYFGVIAFVMACIFIIDLGLYGFWGFRLDATPIFYFFSSPKDAMASIIRKTKCSPLFKRSDISYKTKRPPKNNFPKYSRGSKKNTGKFCFSQCFFL